MNGTKLTRLMISCGGTGGHFNPGLGIGKRLNDIGGESVLIVGGVHAEAQMKSAKENQVRCVSFPYVRPGKNPVTLCRFAFSVLRGIFFSRKLMKEFQPQAILVMGSSVSLPNVLAAWFSRIPIFLHDGNARVGKANRWLSIFAEKAALSFPAVNAKSLRCPTVLTGFPLRTALTECTLTRAESVAELNRLYHTDFEADKPILLICGGSLGAKNINDNFAVDETNPLTKDLQIIHLAGPGKAESLKEKYAKMPCKSLLLEACSRMELIYTACDFIICRSGGSTVSEIAYFGKYALLIPYPYAAEKHQDDNAAWLSSAGGAEIVADKDCTPDLFRDFVNRCLSDLDGILEKGALSKALASPHAADSVLEMIEQHISK